MQPIPSKNLHEISQSGKTWQPDGDHKNGSPHTMQCGFGWDEIKQLTAHQKIRPKLEIYLANEPN